MVHKLVATAAALALALTLGPAVPPASAANAVVEVPGHAGLDRAGLWYIAQRCDNPFANPDSQFAETPVKDAAVLGTHALGWQFPTVGNEVGVLAHVPDPRNLTVIEMHVRGAAGPGLTGHALAIYDDSSANFQGSRWIGVSQATVNVGGWTVGDAGNWDLTWYWYAANGAVLDGPYTLTVKELADARGTNGSGAYAGFAWGCDGQQFFTDALRVGNATNSVTYDYEGLPAASRLQWWAGKKVRTGNFKVGYGSKFYILGDSYDAGTGAFFVGAGTFFEKRHGSTRFAPVKSAGFDLSSYAAYKAKPKRQTTYWFGSDGTNAYEGSVANTLTVKVASGVSGRLKDDTLRPGQRAVVTGRLQPGNRGVKVSLQRRVRSGWSTVSTTKSGSRGSFVLGVKARSPGKMVLRLSIAKGKGNLGTKTNSVTVTVRPRPRPDPPGGGGGGAPTQSQDTSTDSGDTVPPPPYRSLLLLAKEPVQTTAPPQPPPASASCAMPIGLVTGPCTGLGQRRSVARHGVVRTRRDRPSPARPDDR